MCLCQRCKLSEDSSYLSGPKPLAMSGTLAKPSNFPLFLLYTLSKEREFTEVFFLLGSILVLCQPQGQACWQPDVSPLCYLWVTSRPHRNISVPRPFSVTLTSRCISFHITCICRQSTNTQSPLL